MGGTVNPMCSNLPKTYSPDPYKRSYRKLLLPVHNNRFFKRWWVVLSTTGHSTSMPWPAANNANKKLLSTANAPFSVLPYWVTLKYQIIKSSVLCSIFQQDCAESAGVAQLAEHNVANVVVVGSNPITRSLLCTQLYTWTIENELLVNGSLGH